MSVAKFTHWHYLRGNIRIFVMDGAASTANSNPVIGCASSSHTDQDTSIDDVDGAFSYWNYFQKQFGEDGKELSHALCIVPVVRNGLQAPCGQPVGYKFKSSTRSNFRKHLKVHGIAVPEPRRSSGGPVSYGRNSERKANNDHALAYAIVRDAMSLTTSRKPGFRTLLGVIDSSYVPACYDTTKGLILYVCCTAVCMCHCHGSCCSSPWCCCPGPQRCTLPPPAVFLP